MSSSATYLIPSKPHTVEYEIRRSRFIASVGRSENRAAALKFIQSVRQRFSDANHHCYAYVAGSPFNTIEIKMSDDGEPHGTAGKPMLNILQHKKIGEVTAVVTRYFGGIKLGTGGLVRAYSTALSLCLDELPLKYAIALKSAEICMPFSYENTIRRLIEKMNATITEVFYSNNVAMIIQVPEDLKEELCEKLNHHTQGNVSIAWI